VAGTQAPPKEQNKLLLLKFSQLNQTQFDEGSFFDICC
jgi:hypothetical protein